MAVRIRLKKLGRKHRPFFRVVAVDGRRPRDGRVLEELGVYDPLVPEVDARAILKGERIAYWIGVGAQPSDKVAVLIKKYGVDGTCLEEQKNALARLAARRSRRDVAVVAEEQARLTAEVNARIMAKREAEAKAKAEAEAKAKAEAEAAAAANAETENAEGASEEAAAEDAAE